MLMTTLVIHEGKLYGDRKCLVETMPMSFYERPKIFKSSCEQFAFAVMDPGVDPDNPGPMEAKFRTLLEHLILKTPRSATQIRKILGLDVDAEYDEEMWDRFLVITRTQSFGCTVGSVRELRNGSYGVGLEAYTVIGMLNVGMSPEDAFKWVGENTCLSGSTFDVIAQADLKPFVISGGK
jgi:hypothetical protein